MNCHHLPHCSSHAAAPLRRPAAPPPTSHRLRAAAPAGVASRQRDPWPAHSHTHQQRHQHAPHWRPHSHSGSGGASAPQPAGPGGLSGLLRKWQQDTQRMQEQLKALGAAGVIAYGLFNTLYYTVAFLVVWFKVADVPSGMGWAPAAQKAAEVFALVWAGSQVTKLLRAGAALACAPLIDRGLDMLGVRDRRLAYALVVAGCVALAAGVMGLVVVLHA